MPRDNRPPADAAQTQSGRPPKGKRAAPEGANPADDFMAFSVEVNHRALAFFSKPGIPHWDELSPAGKLLAEQAQLPEAGEGLYFNVGHGAAAAALGREHPALRFTWMDRNFVALECARRTRDAAALSHARIWDGIAPPDERLFDFALIELPKGRSVMRRCLAQAFRALKPGAPLWLAGAKDLGVEPAIKDAAALFGPGSAPIYKKGSRLVNFVRPASAPCLPTAPDLAWWDEPGIAPDTWQAFNVTTPGGTLPLVALPGVFAAGRLDDGTALLLDHLPNPAGLRAVDLGCGAGIIGLRMAQRGAAWVDLLDTDLLAVAACQENLRRLGLGDAAAMPSDALSAVQGREYDLIVSNPPFHSGKEVDYRMAQAFIRQSYAALRPKGRLILVANRFIRYERRLEEFFPHPRFLAETRSFHVIMAQKI